MTKQDMEMLVAEIERRLKAGFEAMKAAAAAEMSALHGKVDALHEKVETAMNTPASAVVAGQAKGTNIGQAAYNTSTAAQMAASATNMPPDESHDDHSDHA